MGNQFEDRWWGAEVPGIPYHLGLKLRNEGDELVLQKREKNGEWGSELRARRTPLTAASHCWKEVACSAASKGRSLFLRDHANNSKRASSGGGVAPTLLNRTVSPHLSMDVNEPETTSIMPLASTPQIRSCEWIKPNPGPPESKCEGAYNSLAMAFCKSKLGFPKGSSSIIRSLS